MTWRLNGRLGRMWRLFSAQAFAFFLWHCRNSLLLQQNAPLSLFGSCVSWRFELLSSAFREEGQRSLDLIPYLGNGPHVRPVYRNFAVGRWEIKQGLLKLFQKPQGLRVLFKVGVLCGACHWCFAASRSVPTLRTHQLDRDT